MTIQTIGHAILSMSQQESFLFFTSIALAVWAIRSIYRRKKHHQQPVGEHNFAFVLALLAWCALCVSFPFHIVLAEDRFDWVSACVVLFGTCWVSIGTIMTTKEEQAMLAMLTPAPGALPPTPIETATVKALVGASKFCRSGLVVVAFGSLIQMAHLVDKAHTAEKLGEGSNSVSLQQLPDAYALAKQSADDSRRSADVPTYQYAEWIGSDRAHLVSDRTLKNVS